MPKTKLLVFGSSSLVGSHFVEAFSDKYEMSLAGRKNIFEGRDSLPSFRTVDIQRETDLKKAIRENDSEYVINYAGETNVDGCEGEKSNESGHVYLTNTSAVGWMAEACKQEGKAFFHISTDFVFDGTNGPYSEDDPTGPLGAPIGWYGYTKYLAEKQVIDAIPEDHCILRISYPYRARYEFKTDFARNILDLYKKGKLYHLFTDQLISPTLIDDATRAMDFLISKNTRGVYHVASRNLTTPFEFASDLLSAFFPNSDPSNALKKGLLSEFNQLHGKAPRPVKGGLKTDKIASLGLVLKSTKEGIAEIFEQRKD